VGKVAKTRLSRPTGPRNPLADQNCASHVNPFRRPCLRTCPDRASARQPGFGL